MRLILVNSKGDVVFSRVTNVESYQPGERTMHAHLVTDSGMSIDLGISSDMKLDLTELNRSMAEEL